METTLSRLTSVFREVFDDDTIVLTAGTTADHIQDWDSLMHLTLVAGVEKAFALRFSTAQVALLTDVGELVALIEQLSAARG
jgi:acyl carrier protein